MDPTIRKIPGLLELVKNQNAFKKQRAELERNHFGKIAIFSNEKLKHIAESKEEAFTWGYSECGEGKFSLHEIGINTSKSTGSARPYTLEELEADGLV